MYLTGVMNGTPWEIPIWFFEPFDHKAITQLNEIKKMFASEHLELCWTQQ